MASETTPARGPGRPRRTAWSILRELIVIVVIALLASFLVKAFLVRSFFIPSASMENTLRPGDRILVNELVPEPVALRHGDVIVFADPGGWLPPAAEAPRGFAADPLAWLGTVLGIAPDPQGTDLVKRVIGLPGDHVVCCNAAGRMSVNDVALDEPYVLLPHGITRVSGDDFDVTVPGGSLWVMGDNRYDSSDSRFNRHKSGRGFVPFSDVVGRAVAIIWPIGRWSSLDDYPGTFDDRAAARSAFPKAAYATMLTKACTTPPINEGAGCRDRRSSTCFWSCCCSRPWSADTAAGSCAA